MLITLLVQNEKKKMYLFMCCAFADDYSLFALNACTLNTGDSIEGVLHVSPGKFLSRERPTMRWHIRKQSHIYIDCVEFHSSLSLSLFAKTTTTTHVYL